MTKQSKPKAELSKEDPRDLFKFTIPEAVISSSPVLQNFLQEARPLSL